MSERVRMTLFSETTGKIITIFGFACIIASIFLFLIFGSWKKSTILDEEIIGQFGDFIGGSVGTLFSLTGVILFYVALKEQRRDININQENLGLQTQALHRQIDEFKAQKEELEATRKIFEEQTNLIREQIKLSVSQNEEVREQSTIAQLNYFNSNFYAYLTLLNNSRESLENDNIIQKIIEELIISTTKEDPINLTLEKLKCKFLELFELNREKLSIYFRTLYRVMLLVENSGIDINKKKEYFKLLRSQISEKELVMLYYNYLSNLGIKVRSIVVKYHFLKHLRSVKKIEFFHALNKLNINEINNFLEYLSSSLYKFINRLSDLEEEDKYFSEKSSFFGMEFLIKIFYDERVVIALSFDEIEFNKANILNHSEMQRLVNLEIYSTLFISIFRSIVGNEIANSLSFEEGKLEFRSEINYSF